MLYTCFQILTKRHGNLFFSPGSLKKPMFFFIAHTGRWHTDEGRDVAVAQYDHMPQFEFCPHIALKCSKPMNEFPNSCSGKFQINGKPLWLGVWIYLSNGEVAILRKVVVDRQTTCTSNYHKGHCDLCLDVTGDPIRPPAPPEMEDLPESFPMVIGLRPGETTVETTTAETTTAETTTAETTSEATTSTEPSSTEATKGTTERSDGKGQSQCFFRGSVVEKCVFLKLLYLCCLYIFVLYGKICHVL